MSAGDRPPSHGPTNPRLFLILVVALVLIVAVVSVSINVEPMETVGSDPSALQVHVSVNSTMVEAGHSFAVVIWESSNGWEVNVSVADHWATGLFVYGCIRGWPIGFGLLAGHYAAANLTERGDWIQYPLVWHCPANITTLYYLAFKQQSSTAVAKTDAGTRTYDVNQTVIFNQQVYSFAAGRYTVVAGDEWGHLALAHFSVTT